MRDNENEVKWQQPDRNKIVDKPYISIPYLSIKNMKMFNKNDYVWVEEKIDGSNVSCRIDDESNFRAFGKRFELSANYTNMGAYDWLLTLENVIREKFADKYTFYFEWLVQHKVKYNSQYYNKGYLISVKDNKTDKYLSEDKVYVIAKDLGVDTPTLFYSGPFISIEHLKEMVGKTAFGAKTGEGIVVKAMDKNGTQKMMKIVSEEFAEIMRQKDNKIKRENKLVEWEACLKKVANIVTPARIRKSIFRMAEEGLIGDIEHIDEEQKRTILKYIGKYIYADCIKEEPEFVKDFGKLFGCYAYELCVKYVEENF